MIAAAYQNHRRRDGVSELFANANDLTFRLRQESLYAVIYHPEGLLRIGQALRHGI